MRALLLTRGGGSWARSVGIYITGGIISFLWLLMTLVVELHAQKMQQRATNVSWCLTILLILHPILLIDMEILVDADDVNNNRSEDRLLYLHRQSKRMSYTRDAPLPDVIVGKYCSREIPE